jgi:hypothetical protein
VARQRQRSEVAYLLKGGQITAWREAKMTGGTAECRFTVKGRKQDIGVDSGLINHVVITTYELR